MLLCSQSMHLYCQGKSFLTLNVFCLLKSISVHLWRYEGGYPPPSLVMLTPRLYVVLNRAARVPAAWPSRPRVRAYRPPQSSAGTLQAHLFIKLKIRGHHCLLQGSRSRLLFQRTQIQVPEPTRWFTTIHNSSSTRSDAVFWRLWVPGTLMVHRYTCR